MRGVSQLALLSAAASAGCCQGYLSIMPPDLEVQQHSRHQRWSSALPGFNAIGRAEGGWVVGGGVGQARGVAARGRMMKMAESGAPPAKRGKGKGKGPYKVIANNK